jgi:hypothetical protein
MLLVPEPGSTTAPFFRQEAPSRTLITGQPTVLRATVNGSLPLAYQWYFNSVPVPGQTNYWLSLPSITPEQAGNYQLVATNNSGAATSAVVVVSEVPWATIASQPSNQSAILGSNAAFTVGMYGLPPFYYQWYFGGAPLTDSASIHGSTTASLAISNVQPANGGAYAVVITNAYNSVTSSPATLTVLLPPSFISQPANQAVLVNSNASFTASASGTEPLVYQWLRGGTNLENDGRISGVSTPTLTISGSQTNDNGNYQVIVSNNYGSVTSSIATFTVYYPAQITTQPASRAVVLGGNVSFSATATGSALGFQWYWNGTALVNDGHRVGADSPILTVSNVQSSDVGGYVLVVSNLLSSATSGIASLIPLSAPTSSVHFVNLNNTSPLPPYLDWSTAATNIHDAIDASD